MIQKGLIDINKQPWIDNTKITAALEPKVHDTDELLVMDQMIISTRKFNFIQSNSLILRYYSFNG